MIKQKQLFSTFDRSGPTTLQQQLGEFDLGLAAKAEGLHQASSRSKEILRLARKISVDVAASRVDRLCTMDDVQHWLQVRGHSSQELGNAAGAVFPGTDFFWTGEWSPSKRPSNHSRWIRVWKLKERITK